MGGRGAKATNARLIENMNSAQLTTEIKKTRAALARATEARASAGRQSAVESSMQQAFPLGGGGYDRATANKIAGNQAERAVSRGKALEKAMSEQRSAEIRLANLESAAKTVKGTGKTMKQLQNQSAPTKGTMKWSTVQKEKHTGSSLVPRIIKSGDYEIRGTSVLRVFRNGTQIGTVSSLSAAKALAETDKKRRR